MGLTLIRKGNPSQRNKRASKIALVLAGGAMTGGAFKMGGLKALNDFLVGRGIVDFDIYVGLSAGALLSVPLAAGFSPDEMIRVIDGTSERFEPLRPSDLYTPNVTEIVGRPARLAWELARYGPCLLADFMRGIPGLPSTFHDALGELLRSPDYMHVERMALRLRDKVSPRVSLPAVTEAIPSGFMTNAPVERWVRRNLEKIGVPNDFRAFAAKHDNQLFITACELDTAERVIFGADEHEGLRISEAVQASTALPILYQPARLEGVDYIDGAVRNTANIDVAIDKGADLVICYNPFRPIRNKLLPSEPDSRRIADQGLTGVLNQVFRTLLQSRLRLGLERYRDHKNFEGDIVVIEPKEQDLDFFGLNPLAYRKRDAALRHGYESVRHTVEHRFDELDELLDSHGLRLSRAVAARRAAEIVREREWSDGRERRDSRRARQPLPVHEAP
ncbi:patatin-like phospholipase family protein [Enhygromyxa salina]|uniref:Patatin-like phospholipase n=1 Tax=Enhygromyxa salina TaxID=215803 RepID=A0A2S9YND6_9BACT|nr:patatin-like phospholipase family protein [Enhygromyxa salina]PRQ06595.1 Patatin-like phospholipase [Enhygromyxa salina]